MPVVCAAPGTVLRNLIAKAIRLRFTPIDGQFRAPRIPWAEPAG